jgi:hypothetical protein
MISRIEKDWTFLAAVHFEQRFIINLFEIKAVMDINTENSKHQNVAIERMGYFITSVIEDSIFVEKKEKEAIEKYIEAGLNVVTLPEEPYDQIIGLVLINKFNAIMEDKIVVRELTIGSKLSNLIKFQLGDDTAEAEFSGKHWYNENNLNTDDRNKKDKIVKLFDKKIDWKELELTFTD